MASAAEQLAASINWNSFSKASDLKKRLWFTLGALLVFRLGTYIPIPGIDPNILAEIAQRHSGGILGLFDRFAGGALSRMTVFALGVMPYISSSIIIQLLTAVSPHLEALKKEGESGRKKINQYTRYGTVLLSAMQAYGIAVGLEVMTGASGSVVIDTGFFFLFTTVITLTGGTLFLMWLGEQITSRGIGNGISLIIFSGIIAGMPQAIAATLELGRTGEYSPFFIAIVFALVAGIVGFIVFMERAQRRVFVQYPKRQVGMKMMGGQSTHLPIKLNVSGVIPPIFASSLLLLPMTLSNFTASTGSAFLSNIAVYFSHGNPVYILSYIVLIIFFAFFYTAIVFNPNETADNLKKGGGFVPGYRPGKNTAGYFDYILTRLTFIGAIYLSFVCVLPEILISKFNLPFYLGGTSLLIVVSVGMDTVAQIHSYLLTHQYDGLIKRSKLRGRLR
jgi:preprotein translocase subunit SecY